MQRAELPWDSDRATYIWSQLTPGQQRQLTRQARPIIQASLAGKWKPVAAATEGAGLGQLPQLSLDS